MLHIKSWIITNPFSNWHRYKCIIINQFQIKKRSLTSFLTRSRSLEEQNPVFAFARPWFGTGVNKLNEVSQVHSGRTKIIFNLISDRSLSQGCHAGKKYIFLKYFFLTTTIRALALGHAGGRLVEYTTSALIAWGRTQKR